MPNTTESALRLLIVDDSVEDAEAIITLLRNNGIAVRPLRPTGLGELAAMLLETPIDLVVAAHSATSLSLHDVTRAVRASDKDIPVIGLIDEVDTTGVAEVYLAGARRLGVRSDSEQLLLAIRLEREDLEARRALRRLDAQVRETERRCDALIESSRDPIAYVHEGMHIRANPAYLEMFGFESFADLEGMSVLDLVGPQHTAEFKQLIKAVGKGDAPPPAREIEARDSRGTLFPAAMELIHALYEGEACLQVMFRRREQDPELARKLEELRQRDQATGLLNRSTFLHALEDAVADAAQHRGQHGLLLIEPDHCQRLLHDIGLDASDPLMARLADLLRSALEGEADALAARFSEHGLAVLLRNADYPATHAIAERIRSQLAAIIAIGPHSCAITTSIGGVQIAEKVASVTRVLAQAHQCVQASAGVGGNRVEIFDPGADDRAEQDRIQAWVERLRSALEQDAFVLHYQPVISLQGAADPAYEVMLRLDSGGDELIAPATFLPLAEQHGLLGQIDCWMAEHAVRALARRPHAPKPTTLMLPVSHASLENDKLATTLAHAIREHGIDGRQLVLLVSEAKVFSQLNAARAFGERISELGCRLALEDFGVALDSFQLLAHLRPAFVKLDRSFTLELPANMENRQVVQDIAQRACAAGIQSIAEHVQDAASMSILFQAGIDSVQGDFLAPAGPQMRYEFE